MSALMQLPLAMPEVQVLATECRPAGPLLIPVASTRQGTYCSQGGRELHPWQGDDRPMQGRHLPMLGRPVSRAMRPQRYRCRPGEGRPTPTPRCEWDEPNRPPTQALEKGSWRNRVNSTGAAVSPQLGWGPAAVAGIRGRWVSTPVDWRQLTPREIGGIAEMALTRGPGNYVAVLSSRDPPGQVVLLAGRPDRRPVTVQALLESMPALLPATIQPVCTDRDAGYGNAVYAALPRVTVGVARFPGAQSDHDRVEQRRQQELQRLHQALPAAAYDPLQGVLGVGRQDGTGLSDADHQRWLPLVHQSPALEQAYGLRQVLTGLVNSPLTTARATDALAGWGAQVRARGFRCFAGFLTTGAN